MQDSLHIAVDDDLKISVLKSLAYSAVFSYPLTRSEIMAGLDREVSQEKLSSEIEKLVGQEVIVTNGKFYALRSESDNFKLRSERNIRAEKYLKLARFISRFIGNFPFVRAVFISGSLSKMSMDKDSDIDYFIIRCSMDQSINGMLYNI